MTELLIILGLIILNGVFAMSEMAIVSARRARLQDLADQGNAQARIALELATNPDRFLSTVQIGITLIGIVAGAFGGAALSEPLARALQPILGDLALTLSAGFIVIGITYMSLVVGELVPKRLALQNAEAIACFVAGPMSFVSQLATPLVWLLSQSSGLIIRLLGIDQQEGPAVTEGEVLSLLREGASSGVFEAREQEMVEAMFRLDDQRIGGLVTPRKDIVWLDVNDDDEAIYQILSEAAHSTYPVCEGSVDNMLGIVRLKDLVPALIQRKPLDLRAAMHPPLYVPENVAASEVLQRFRTSGIHTALVINEFGDIHGLVTIKDLLEEIVGEIEDMDAEDDDREAVQRPDGSWLFDGTLPIYRLEDYFPTCKIEEERDYETLGGFVLSELQRIPQVGDSFEWQSMIFEVVDMDGRRIDKVLVRSLVTSSNTTEE
ncbi:MAG: hemolysin family protein [Anaerolineae bacterium]|nr:hemolysin family protein [Anaerolineae bacterium]MDW8173029.1 hemolysin family protein [Anaerolineae bacterium]